jgi:spore coat polysaccharide biosynthesis protein SpsF
MERMISMKVLCVVQARMGSERLEGKVIKPLLEKPIILHVLDRLKRSKYIDDIVLATSELEREEPLVDVVLKAGYKVFRGDEKNVLKRYKEAVDLFEGDVVVRITGDCPLIDWNVVDNVISNFYLYSYDYVRLDVPDTFIRGFDVEVFFKSALDKAYEIVSNLDITKKNHEVMTENINMYKEHVTLYMYRHPEDFNIGYVKGESLYRKNYRLCVDTYEDFTVVNSIFEHFNDKFISAKDAVMYLDNHKNIANINSEIIQKKV